MAELGKVLVLFGIVMVAAGVAFMLLGRLHLPIGRLPGALPDSVFSAIRLKDMPPENQY
jgi:Protein of unknown function (DUF2905)